MSKINLLLDEENELVFQTPNSLVVGTIDIGIEGEVSKVSLIF